jgi:hypothetical protein
VDLVPAVAVLVTSVLSPTVADRLMFVAPFGEAVIDGILVGMDQRAFGDTFLDDRLDSLLLDIGQHMEDNLSTSLNQPEDRRAPPRNPG